MVVHSTVSKRIPSSCFSFISISPHARRISVVRVRHLPCRLRISPPPCGGYCPWVRPELSYCVLYSCPAVPVFQTFLDRQSAHALYDFPLRRMPESIHHAFAEDH